MFDFRVVTQWVDATLHQYLPASLVTTTEFVLVGVCLLVAYAVMALGLIYAERKVCAFFQCRLGPNRVGPFGMIQTVTDMIKMLIKEIIEINHVDRFLFNLAPYIVIIASLLAFSCIPFAKGLEITRSRIGTDGRLPYRIFGHALRFLLRGRIRQYVYCGSRSDYLILGRLDAFTYTGLGKFQHRDGLHPFDLLVSGKKCRYGIYHHVV